MENRPKIDLKLSKLDIVLEIFGWSTFIAIWVFVLINFSSLPDIIPTHFNGAGEANGFGKKINIIILPLIGSITYIALNILNKYPHIFNYPTDITKENALYQYTNATKLIRVINLITILTFGFIVLKIIQFTKGNSDGLGIWFLVLIIASFMIPVIYYLIKSSGKINTKAKQ